MFFKRFNPRKIPRICLRESKDGYGEEWSSIAKETKKRVNYRCELCGSGYKLQTHHKVPISKGGSNSPSNLIVLCFYCHKKQHKHMQKPRKRWK